ncbi:hypothetical protein A2W54_00910 [Candidatus Giovannonibacteria bacterium RIFCSPHIGHO2_02_43_13]|uniref:Damage-inducible protein J n=1 Tax=Candidatus Giovannonibacteria bacterium RIFCSPHIGHO2_02_43_13 TaxID=1798330 RepID=A0A1F5WTZ3_9BACT|nr:MAG: hypothetical protein UW28_C0008G0023 [Parcubacteria group bacterium GW2011_GWA2_44_13]OGF73129.1 MAG: hypothetical protein A3E06_01310 [Candidatus Giovannonibacteria bacterium RIFCSPHIGHO2_12_FULL_44_42]OGF79094.1 MAG: hypothetical protein A2W54_00910 [Candidatus Giovannonibacteria bacterium RIFCSPHIGHO2_02_43_13]OGF90141.1 MAG: hypothetical protein A3I94_02000 [Candidatus Giovannonibacteria bacterium RIFCSPLOWO2_02_FULL_43_54]OGF97315.1 MAG: hypothetical protein A3H08_00825 [Candidatus
MKTLINVKADKEVKENAQKIAEALGLPLSSIINAYLKEFIRDQAVRFSVEPQLRPEVARLLLKASSDYKRKKNTSGIFETWTEAKKYLRDQ